MDIFFAATAFASCLVPCGGPGQTDCTVCHFFLLTKDALYYSLALFSLIAGVLLAVSGLNLMANRGNVQSTGRSKKVITAVLAGLAIIFAGWAGVSDKLKKVFIKDR